MYLVYLKCIVVSLIRAQKDFNFFILRSPVESSTFDLSKFHFSSRHVDKYSTHRKKNRHTQDSPLASVRPVLGRCVGLFLMCRLFSLCVCVDSCLSWLMTQSSLVIK